MTSEASDPVPDEVLLGRVRKGDPEAFQVLFDHHLAVLRARVLRLLPARMRRRVSVADVLQEARLAAFRGSGGFKPRVNGTIRGWLLKITENEALTALRRHDGAARRSAGREISHGGRPDTAAFAGAGPSPSEAAASAEVRDAVRAALDEIPEDYSKVLELVRLEGLTMAEAAFRMGRSREAVKKLYGRALGRLSEVLRRDRPGGLDG
jgi:RNA polymerase sigma-70 factor (ECF subfamily)